jgi:hypothetical protein
MTEEDSVVTDTLRVVMTLRRHLDEAECKHTIRSILEEGLECIGTGPREENPAPTGQATIFGVWIKNGQVKER